MGAREFAEAARQIASWTAPFRAHGRAAWKGFQEWQERVNMAP